MARRLEVWLLGTHVGTLSQVEGRLGGECAGAVTLLEPGESPRAVDGARDVHWLDHAQLLQVLDADGLRVGFPPMVGHTFPVIFSCQRL